MEELTKEKAFELMNEGKKITHRYFSSDEWMTIKNGKIEFEDGCRCSFADFFHYRKGESWENGYTLFN